MKHFTFLSMMAAVMILCGMPVMAQDVSDEETEVRLVSVRPSETAATIVGSVDLTFNMQPTPNKACAEPARFYIEGELESSVYSSSGSVQMFGEGMAQEEVIIAFTRYPIKTPGEYKVTIPAGFFTFKNGTLQNDEIELSFTIPHPMPMTVIPSTGYYKDVPTTFIITIPGAKEIKINELVKDSDGLGVLAFFASDGSYDIVEETLTAEVVGNRIFINVIRAKDSFTEPFIYDLMVPVGAFTVTYEDGSVKDNSAYSFKYIISRIPRPDVTPAPGRVTSLQEVTLSFDENLDITFNRWLINPSLYSIDAQGNADSRILSFPLATPSDWVNGSTELTFKTANAYSVPGNYRLKVGASSFSCNGRLDEENPDVMTVAWANCDYWYDYTIIESPTIIKIPEGEEKFPTLKTGDMLNLWLPYALPGEVSINPAVKPYIADVFEDELSQYSVTLSFEDGVAVQSEDAGVYVKAEITPPVTAAGEYALFVPAGALETADGSRSSLYFRSFKVDPTVDVDAVTVSDPVVDVYSVDGVCVAHNILGSQINELPKGLYIVKGRKVLVK
ncbi:MAG: hypothetical protein K2N03_03825 [Muribaculaceae bacterium]|nr:hypothetical protein [Muribaculaceae bacterium]